MALQKEIWLQSIVENLFADNSFVSKSVNDSAFVNYKTVHIPNAGAPSKVVVNRTDKPAGIKTREDKDLTYTLDELTTDPILIENIDTVQLSYDKRESVISTDRAQLIEAADSLILHKWGTGAESAVYYTTGAAVDAHTSTTATGQRKAITRKDILALMTKFNQDNVSKQDRYILLDSIMYAQLLEDMTESDKRSFFACADAEKGIIGGLYSFNFMERSQVLRLSADKKILGWDKAGVAGELAAGFAWQKECVSHALGNVDMFGDTGNPAYYGDIYSFLVMCGGACRRYDKKGVALIAGATAE